MTVQDELGGLVGVAPPTAIGWWVLRGFEAAGHHWTPGTKGREPGFVVVPGVRRDRTEGRGYFITKAVFESETTGERHKTRTHHLKRRGIDQVLSVRLTAASCSNPTDKNKTFVAQQSFYLYHRV